MVSTVRPKARATPSIPIPTCGTPAAITALPQPPNVNQKVPIASAANLLPFITILPGYEVVVRNAKGPLRWQKGATGSCRPEANGAHSINLSARDRAQVERFFNKIKQCRRVATRCHKLANDLAFTTASFRLWLRVNESTPQFGRPQ